MPGQTAAKIETQVRYIDIGANMLDDMFQGNYRGKQVHPPDFDAVLGRACAAGVERVIVTAGSLEESVAALNLVRSRRSGPVQLYTTVGVHPTRCLEFLPVGARTEMERGMTAVAEAQSADGGASGAQGIGGANEAEAALLALEGDVLRRSDVAEACDAHLGKLRDVLRAGVAEGLVVAVGECGLDYDRLHFCPAGVQRLGFEAQLQLSQEFGLPTFLHNRNTAGNFGAVCSAQRELMVSGGVVHSFDGGEAELQELLALGLHIGLNGCSLKTAGNLAVAAHVPLEALHLETDAPWCGIKRSHSSFAHVQPVAWPEAKKEKWAAGSCVKDRSEPCHISQVAQVVAAVQGVDVTTVAAHAYENSLRMFFERAI